MGVAANPCATRQWTMDNWLEISCPFCRAPFKIKEAYAHLRGRCPSCGFRIEPIKPKPYEEQKYVSTSDEPVGLIPIDEEWPEPATLIAWDDRPMYGLAPPQSAAPQGAASSSQEADIPGSAPIPFADEPAQPARPSAATPQKPVAPPPKIVRAEAVKEPERPAAASKPPIAPDPITAFAPPDARDKAPPALPAVDILGEPIVTSVPKPQSGPDPLARTQEMPDLKPVMPPRADLADDLPPLPQPKQAEPDLYRFAGGGIDTGQGGAVRRNEIDFEVPPTPPVPPPEPPPLEPHSPYQLSDAELDPEKPPPVPLLMFWTGVWNFAFRPANLLRLFWLTLGFSVIGFQVVLMLVLYEMGGILGEVIGFLIGVGVVFMVVLAGSYAASSFLQILQDTANGADEIQYPDGDWRMGAINLARLAWLTFLGLVGPFLILSLLGCLGYGLFILLTPALFAFCLLSALSRDSWFIIFDPQVLEGLKRRPDVIPIVYVFSLVFLVACLITTFVAMRVTAWFVPVMAFTMAVCWLTFGRVLGRVGYALTEDPRRKRKKKRKKKRKARSAVSAAEPEEDGDVPEVSPEDNPA